MDMGTELACQAATAKMNAEVTTMNAELQKGNYAAGSPEAVLRTVRFIQLGAGARFDDGGLPVRFSQP